MKRTLAMLTAGILALGLAACGKSDNSDTKATSQAATAATTKATEAETEKSSEATMENAGSEAQASEETTENSTSEETTTAVPHKEVLVVYFSATGTTKDVAEKIAAIEDADLYEIVPAEPYSDDDLNWNDSESRSTKEQNDSSARPKIGSDVISLEGYTKVYVGYPIWWGEEPRILDTFVESYNFDGMTMIPFCTSASSGVGRSDKNLEKHAGSGTWLDGKRFGAGPSEDTVHSWIEGIK